MGREDERPLLHGQSGGRWVGAVAGCEKGENECPYPWSEPGERRSQLREKRWSGWSWGKCAEERENNDTPTPARLVFRNTSGTVSLSHLLCPAPTHISFSRPPPHSSSPQQKSKFKIKFKEENIVVLGLFTHFLRKGVCAAGGAAGPAPFHAKPAGEAGLEWRSRRALIGRWKPIYSLTAPVTWMVVY
uniref:Uncharacterized protein n=1 Tax=Rangifer tarandus platyrhynchus TaxID=3082113 RepID=A0ACB0FAL2_RANTA|nr:unnamed protein product [Rangifer tarandus platyrhynchus]